jgi:hypothetical protein
MMCAHWDDEKDAVKYLDGVCYENIGGIYLGSNHVVVSASQ